jgi:hypothetical protein
MVLDLHDMQTKQLESKQVLPHAYGAHLESANFCKGKNLEMHQIIVKTTI